MRVGHATYKTHSFFTITFFKEKRVMKKRNNIKEQRKETPLPIEPGPACATLWPSIVRCRGAADELAY